MTLHKNIREASNGISYEDYMQGNTLYAFDLTPDLCLADHFNLLKDGSLDLDVHLEKDPKATPNPALVTSGAGGYTAMFYLEFDNIIEITKERQVLVDRLVDHLIFTILNIILKIQSKNVITVTIEFKVILIFVAYIVYFIFYLKREIKRKFFSLNSQKI